MSCFETPLQTLAKMVCTSPPPLYWLLYKLPYCDRFKYELRRKKTVLRGFRPGPTQTELHKLGNLDLGRRRIVLSKTKALISFAVTAKLICAFVFALAKIWFLSHLLIAGCDIGVQISVRPFVRPSVRPSVNIYVEV